MGKNWEKNVILGELWRYGYGVVVVDAGWRNDGVLGVWELLRVGGWR